MNTRIQIIALLCGSLLVMCSMCTVRGQNASFSYNLPVTNLLQLIQLMSTNERVVADVKLDATVCAASDPAIGVMILQDGTDTELMEFGRGEPAISPGDRIRIDRTSCFLRRREMGVQISTVPVVDNDGIHSALTSFGGIALKTGRHPLTLDWFNRLHDGSLEVRSQISDAPAKEVSDSVLSHGVSGGNQAGTAFQPGLQVECYEGDWQEVPDFSLLKPVKSGVTRNFDLKIRTHDELAGLRFSGYFDAPTSAVYTFTIRSADGSLLFIGDPTVRVKKIGRGVVPKPAVATIDRAMANFDKQQWLSIEGRVGSISPAGRGLDLKLYSQRNSVHVRIADTNGMKSVPLLNSRIRVTGVGCGVFDLRGGAVLGEVFAANGNDVDVLSTPNADLSTPLVKAEQVRSLSLEEARRGVPVDIRGVVTSVGRIYDHWLSIQDDTRGIFVNLHAISNVVRECGDFYEIIGHSGAGDFAPVVIADKIIRLGKGELPKPARPTWNELMNGSMDVQRVEIQGLVTGVHSNILSMLLPEGEINVQVEGQATSRLPALKRSVVRVEGVLFAVWNTNREVQAGSVDIRNSTISVAIPAPADPFDAVLKTPRDLLLFDAQATAYRRVKVRGQIVYASANQIFLMEDGAGLRILPAEKTDVRAGDLVEAVGYPDIGETTLSLREARLRKIGRAPLPPPRKLAASELTQDGLDSTRVRVEGKLLGWHLEQGWPVLEMQSDTHLYLARLAPEEVGQLSLRTGSRLALKGVYVAHGGTLRTGSKSESFELLLNSPADIAVLSQPSWWTLQRLLILVGILLLVLLFTAVWITQLRRLVEQRTAQLEREIREREHIEHQHALETERSRIARDLHDDLGSSLTEIGVLASTGLRREEAVPVADVSGFSGREDDGQSGLFQAIAAKARSLIAALDVIVWAVDPEDNLLQSLADYLSGYADEFFSHTNISCRFKVPMVFPQITLDGRVRHDLLMAVKETLNNIVRHSEATEVEFRMAVAGGSLEIEISDNGKGFEGGTGGHGLKNLSARLLKLGGSCTVESRVGGGTTVKIRLPLPSPDEIESAWDKN